MQLHAAKSKPDRYGDRAHSRGSNPALSVMPGCANLITSANLAFSLGWSVFVSHRSGETTDDFIADLTVGIRTGHLKTGAPARGERVAKYNRLMDIEDEIKASGQEVKYAGVDF